MKIDVITVTKQDIQEGEMADCAQCPVALAVRRYYRTPTASVQIGTIAFYDYAKQIDEYDLKFGWLLFPMPPAVNEFIEQFDAGKRPAPFTFYLWRLPTKKV